MPTRTGLLKKSVVIIQTLRVAPSSLSLRRLGGATINHGISFNAGILRRTPPSRNSADAVFLLEGATRFSRLLTFSTVPRTSVHPEWKQNAGTSHDSLANRATFISFSSFPKRRVSKSSSITLIHFPTYLRTVRVCRLLQQAPE
jgi:hypothetical protein